MTHAYTHPLKKYVSVKLKNEQTNKQTNKKRKKRKKRNLNPRWINQMIKLGQVIVTKLCCDLVK